MKQVAEYHLLHFCLYILNRMSFSLLEFPPVANVSLLRKLVN